VSLLIFLTAALPHHCQTLSQLVGQPAVVRGVGFKVGIACLNTGLKVFHFFLSPGNYPLR